MKKATKFNTILGIINIFFFVVIAMCVLLKTGVEGVVNKAKTFIGLGVDYFKGITEATVTIAIFGSLIPASLKKPRAVSAAIPS